MKYYSKIDLQAGVDVDLSSTSDININDGGKIIFSASNTSSYIDLGTTSVTGDVTTANTKASAVGWVVSYVASQLTALLSDLTDYYEHQYVALTFDGTAGNFVEEVSPKSLGSGETASIVNTSLHVYNGDGNEVFLDKKIENASVASSTSITLTANTATAPTGLTAQFTATDNTFF